MQERLAEKDLEIEDLRKEFRLLKRNWPCSSNLIRDEIEMLFAVPKSLTFHEPFCIFLREPKHVNSISYSINSWPQAYSSSEDQTVSKVATWGDDFVKRARNRRPAEGSIKKAGAKTCLQGKNCGDRLNQKDLQPADGCRRHVKHCKASSNEVPGAIL